MSARSELKIVRVDYDNTDQAGDLISMLNHYALTTEGGGAPLSEYVHRHLIDGLKSLPDSISILGYIHEEPVALLNAFKGFSSFKAKPLYNVHDLAVKESARGLGIAGRLLDELANIAKKQGCCKLTLEVLSNNTPALSCYQKNGFQQYALVEEMGTAQFWQRML